MTLHFNILRLATAMILAAAFMALASAPQASAKGSGKNKSLITTPDSGSSSKNTPPIVRDHRKPKNFTCLRPERRDPYHRCPR